VAKVNDCPGKRERDLAELYLAGRLPEEEAEAFEAHYFGCETCREDVERGSEIRAALGRPAVAPVAKGKTTPSSWRLLAAAAAVVIVGLGVWQLTHQSRETQSSPVLRGGATEALSLKLETLPEGRIKLTWAAHPEAQEYAFQVLRSDGVAVLKQVTRETTLILDRSTLAPPPPGISFLTRIEALDTTGQIVAATDLRPLPAR